MIQTLENFGDTWLGLNLDASDFQLRHLLLRGFIIFFSLLFMIRVAGRRFLANRNPLDVLLTFILASMLARGINGNTPFFSTIGAGFFLVGLYRTLAVLACHSHRFGRWLKGESEKVIENGQVHLKTLARHHVSEHDLMEDLRLNGNVNDIKEVKLAQLERNGAISAVK